jgi:fatty aldehyde-generating acyl-ACP reductase
MNKLIYPGCNLIYLQQTLKVAKKLLYKVDSLYSPYSVIPVISQLLGLNTPLTGEGGSPYSITSHIFLLKNNKADLCLLDSIPFDEKRKIIDEIYNFIAPIILNEDRLYIDLLIRTRYEKQFNRLDKKQKSNFKAYLFKKRNVIKPFVRYFLRRKGDFAHLAHYGYLDDLDREFGFLNDMSKKARDIWFKYSYPVVAEITLKKAANSNRKIKKHITGWAILVPNSTEQLLKDGQLRKRKILQAAKLGAGLGAKISGMGGLIASFAGGGFYLAQKVKSSGFTTGHAYTVANIMKIFEKVTSQTGINPEKLKIAIVGAGGSIGSGCAKFLAEKNIRNLILIDTTSFISIQKLAELKSAILSKNPNIDVFTSGNLNDTRKAGLVIVATNSPFSIIKSCHLKKGAIVIDDSFPKNVSKETSDRRKDSIFLEGGAVQLPLDLEVYMARNMPDLVDAPLTRLISCRELYSSFSETVILAFNKWHKNYCLGNADIHLAKDILKKADNVGIKPAALQFFGQAIDSSRFVSVRKNHRIR